MLPITADLIIEPTWLLPIVPARTVLTGHSVAIRGANIVAIGPSQTIQQQFRATASPPTRWTTVDAGSRQRARACGNGAAARPRRRSAARRMAAQQDLATRGAVGHAGIRRRRHRARTCSKCSNPARRASATCTTFRKSTAHAARDCGMRAQITFPLIDFANAWSKNAAEGFSKGLALHDEYRDDVLDPDRLRSALRRIR